MAHENTFQVITNALVTSRQLQQYQHAQSVNGIDDGTIFRASLTAQTGGVLLRLPQEVIAASIILFQRFLVVDALAQISVSHVETTAVLARYAAVSTYIAAKQSFYPLAPRSIINVYGLIASNENLLVKKIEKPTNGVDRPDYYVSEGQYQARRLQMFEDEQIVLRTIGFDTNVARPYPLALTYLQTLSVDNVDLSQRVLAHLNTSLLSPQMLYLTHQPHVLAVAAIYLSALELEINLIADEIPWWEVFDVSREELGFIVLSLGSINNFVEALT